MLALGVGPNNMFKPGLTDRGKPTHFLPRQQTGVFTVVVPADFGDDAAPVLPAGTIIKLTAWRDNSATNRANPDPT